MLSRSDMLATSSRCSCGNQCRNLMESGDFPNIGPGFDPARDVAR